MPILFESVLILILTPISDIAVNHCSFDKLAIIRTCVSKNHVKLSIASYMLNNCVYENVYR